MFKLKGLNYKMGNLYTPTTLAKKLGVSRQAISKAIKAGRIVSNKIGGIHIIYWEDIKFNY